MRTININGKTYPFIISAANAKANSELASKAEESNVSDMIDQYTSLVHMGLQDGRMALPWYKRIFHFIPSKERLEHLIPFNEMLDMVNGEALPKVEEDGAEKKH